MGYKKVVYNRLILICLISFIGLCFFLFLKSNFFNKSEENTQYTDYHSYAQAVSLVVTDINGALNLCSKSGEMKDECFVKIAKIISEQNFRKSLDICEKIINIGWKDECFFGVAESLLSKNASLAAKICEKSGIFQLDCYSNLDGAVWGDVSAGISACNQVSIEFRHNCFEGLGTSFNQRLSGDINAGVSACNQIPVEFRSDCFKSLGHSVGQYFGSDIKSGISACKKIPDEFRDYCFQGLETVSLAVDNIN